MTELRAITAEEFAAIAPVVEKYGITKAENCLRFIDPQWDKTYDVWLLEGEKGKLILKKDKKRRGDKTVYDAYFAGHDFAVPKILDAAELGNDLYVVMEYAEGEDARGCSEKDAARIGKELARIQSEYLQTGGNEERIQRYFTVYVEEYWDKVKGFFQDGERAFNIVRERFFAAPRTLVHDDLLPLNVLVDGTQIRIIDWETAEIFPYFLDLARFAFVGGKDSFYISHDSATAFLNAYYEEMQEKSAFSFTKQAFLRDVAVSAFCQYAMFLSYANAETIEDTEDYKYLFEIIDYLNRTK